MAEVAGIIDAADMSASARDLAKKIFMIIARAEAKAHDTTADKVHFHEVGAIDSIVDVISFAVCFDDLGIDEVIIPSVSEGCGTIRCAHGILPIPVPATLAIAEANDLKLRMTGIKGELITPTGAAIAAAIRTKDSLPEVMSIEKTGLGAGKRSYEIPSMLRAMLIDAGSEKTTGKKTEKTSPADTDDIWKLETDIDDTTGEALGFVMEELFKKGARDVHYIPVYMKKNRPGWELCVICDQALIEDMERVIFTHTTTIGIRRIKLGRSVLKRVIKTIDTPWGAADVKICSGSGIKRVYPEYESVAAICKKTNEGFSEVFDTIRELAGSI